MKNKKKVLIIVGILLFIGLCLGISYAYYIATTSQQGENVVRTDCFKITYSDQDVISLNNSFPMRDSDGEQLTPYQFTVKNVCENSQYYEANLETLSTSSLDESLMKVKLDNRTPYLYGSNGYADNKVISDSKNAIKLDSGSLAKNEERTYNLRLWLNENVTIDTPNVQNKSYKAKVTIFASQNNRSFQIAIQRNNSTIKEDRVQGTKIDGVQYEFDLANTDITSATNIACNEDAIPTIEDNKLKISNMHENTICKINDTLKSTIDNLDETRNVVKMIKNESNVLKMDINPANEVTLDLNGKKVYSSAYELQETNNIDNNSIFFVKGRLKIEDLNNDGGLYNGTSARPIQIKENGHIVINGGYYIGRHSIYSYNADNSYLEINNGIFENNYNAVISYGGTCVNCNVKINGGTFRDDGVNGNIYLNTSSVSNFEINGGTFTTTLSSISVSAINKMNLTINNGDFTAGTTTIYNGGTSPVNINGGYFISTGGTAIHNNVNGTININQSSNPVYISTLAQVWSPAITNSGTFNIRASIANNCTDNKADTTTGLCLYAVGDQDFDTMNSNTTINNLDSGTFTIDGGHYHGGRNSIRNSSTNNFNIKNAYFYGLRDGIYSNSTASINICNSTILTGGHDLAISSNYAGVINYYNVTFSNNANTPDTSKIYNPIGTINKLDACPF